MTKQQSQVREFMHEFGQKTPDKPTMPDLHTRILRCKLILEEAIEFCAACGVSVVAVRLAPLKIGQSIIFGVTDDEPDIAAYADATADLRVVVTGADVAAGIDGEPMDEIVHRSNMSKVWQADEVETIAGNAEGVHITACERGNPDAGYVVKNKDGKVIKPVSWYAPDIGTELLRQGCDS